MRSLCAIPLSFNPETDFESPRVVIISGPSGTGKGTIINGVMGHLQATEPERVLSKSWTTRPKRDGDTDGAYNFVTREEFKAKIEADGFLEHAEVFGNYYGTPTPIQDQKVILEIDVSGALQVKERAQRLGVEVAHRFLFVVCETPDILLDQLMSRPDGTEPAKKYKRYKTFFDSELPLARSLGAHVIVNRSLPHSVANVLAAIRGTYFCDSELEDVINRYEQYNTKELDELLEYYTAPKS